MYQNCFKFIFVFYLEYSYEDFSILSWVDDDLLGMLKYLEENNYLNNIMLILMSDYGV